MNLKELSGFAGRIKSFLEPELKELEPVEYSIKLSFAEEREKRIFAVIELRDFQDSKSYLAFTYNLSKKHFNHIRAALRGKFAKKSYDFLKALEKLAKSVNCCEMIVKSDEEFWMHTGWIRFPDRTYRKNLLNYLN